MTMMMMIMRLWKQQVASMHAYVCMDERAHHSADIAAFLKATSTRFYCCAHRFLIFRQQQKKKLKKSADFRCLTAKLVHLSVSWV